MLGVVLIEKDSVAQKETARLISELEIRKTKFWNFVLVCFCMGIFLCLFHGFLRTQTRWTQIRFLEITPSDGERGQDIHKQIMPRFASGPRSRCHRSQSICCSLPFRNFGFWPSPCRNCWPHARDFKSAGHVPIVLAFANKLVSARVPSHESEGQKQATARRRRPRAAVSDCEPTADAGAAEAEAPDPEGRGGDEIRKRGRQRGPLSGPRRMEAREGREAWRRGRGERGVASGEPAAAAGPPGGLGRSVGGAGVARAKHKARVPPAPESLLQPDVRRACAACRADSARRACAAGAHKCWSCVGGGAVRSRHGQAAATRGPCGRVRGGLADERLRASGPRPRPP